MKFIIKTSNIPGYPDVKKYNFVNAHACALSICLRFSNDCFSGINDGIFLIKGNAPRQISGKIAKRITKACSQSPIQNMTRSHVTISGATILRS